MSSLVRPSQVFVGLGFPYEGPAPIEAIALGCVLLQPRFDPPHSSDNNDFYKGKPTTRQVCNSSNWKMYYIEYIIFYNLIKCDNFGS